MQSDITAAIRPRRLSISPSSQPWARSFARIISATRRSAASPIASISAAVAKAKGSAGPPPPTVPAESSAASAMKPPPME